MPASMLLKMLDGSNGKNSFRVCKKLPWVNAKMRKRKRGAWKLEPISWAQMKYIKILSDCSSTAKEDKEDINNFLGFQRKNNIDELNKGEARELISKLLERRIAQGIAPAPSAQQYTPTPK